MREGNGAVLSGALLDMGDAGVDGVAELWVFVVVQCAFGYGRVSLRFDVSSGGGVDEQGVGDGEGHTVQVRAVFRVERCAAGLTDQDDETRIAGGDPDRCAVRPDWPSLVEDAVLVEVGHAWVHLVGGAVDDLLDADDAVVGAAPVCDDDGIGRGRCHGVPVDSQAGIDGVEHEPGVRGPGLVELLPRCVVGLECLEAGNGCKHYGGCANDCSSSVFARPKPVQEPLPTIAGIDVRPVAFGMQGTGGIRWGCAALWIAHRPILPVGRITLIMDGEEEENV